MALQHFYSRVPARVSMFKRADGFDTFAHSEGLDREFIEKELAACYENKLNKVDAAQVRSGALAPVYCQYRCRSGQVVHSCVSYLPLDYTGERSTYLAHSLVLSEDECSSLFYVPTGGVFNLELFVKDISGFQLTAAEAAPNSSYPQLTYAPRAEENLQTLLGKYDEEAIKAFLMAALMTICGKGKTVYFKLPVENSQISEEALRFVGGIMAVIPYHLRSALTFVTYINDPAQYPSMKLKCCCDDMQEIPAAKGVFFDFHTNMVSGLKNDDLNANKQLTNFLYACLKDSVMREAFLKYIDDAVAAMPNLRTMNMKVLNDLVFLFGQCGGFFPESAVLPNDAKVYDFICVYDKYRAALKDHHRVAAYQCLKRYPQNHEAIPKNTFAKVAKLYPTEVNSAREIVMNIVLDLIHTDIMRDKLFVFIKNNYEAECPEVRRIINEDLARVYYGGFLQTQLLNFFTQYFATEPEQTQNTVLEKLLLTIRTPAVQAKILSFVETNYGSFTVDQKEKFYQTYFEMLPECDGLAKDLTGLVNRVITAEPEQFREETAQKICQLLQADQRKQEPKMLPVLTEHKGYCADVVTRLIFTDWSGRKIFEEYLLSLQEKSFAGLVEETIYICTLAPNMTDIVAKRFLASVKESMDSKRASVNLYDWLSADEQVCTAQMGRYGLAFHQQVVLPAVRESLHDAFKIRYKKDGVDIVQQYAQQTPEVCEGESYKTIQIYRQLAEGIVSSNATVAFKCALALPQDAGLRGDIAQYLQTCLRGKMPLPEDAEVVLELCADYLRSGKLTLTAHYDRYTAKYTQELTAKAEKPNAQQIAWDSGCKAILLILHCCQQICNASAELGGYLCDPASDLESMMTKFINLNAKKAKKWLAEELDRMGNHSFTQYCKGLVDRCKVENKGLFARFFGKK